MKRFIISWAQLVIFLHLKFKSIAYKTKLTKKLFYPEIPFSPKIGISIFMT